MPCLRSILALVAFNIFIRSCFASLYVINPQADTTCHAGQSCQIEWLDDGTEPLLSEIGLSTIGLYHGEMQLVQSIEAVDISSVHSLSFTPNAEAGPNSNTYYVAFTSTVFSNSSGAFQAFTPTFSLDGMTGSFDSPVASLTSAQSIAASVSSSTSLAPISTVTLSNTASLSISTNPASSFTPSSSSATSTGTSAASSGHSASSGGSSAGSASGAAASSSTTATSGGAVGAVAWGWTWTGLAAILSIFFA